MPLSKFLSRRVQHIFYEDAAYTHVLIDLQLGDNTDDLAVVYNQ